MKATRKREGRTVGDVASELVATTERNNTLALLIQGQQAGLLNQGMNAELKRKLEAIGRAVLQGEPDSDDEQGSDDDDDDPAAGWDEDEDDATFPEFGEYDEVEWLESPDMEAAVAAAEASTTAASTAATAAAAAAASE